MPNFSNVWDWSFMWGVFGFLLKIVAPFIMIVVGIYAVGMLLKMVIQAVRSSKG